MSIRSMFLLIFLLLMGLLLSFAYLSHLSSQNQNDWAMSEIRRYQSYKLADELRQSSDDLTRLARTYVVTGDPTYKQYFHDVLAIRNGDKPRPKGYGGIYWDFVVATGKKPTPDGKSVSLQNLMRGMNFTAEELAKLGEANARSDALVRLEEKAMNAVKGKFDDGSGNFTIAKEPDLEMARQIMHGEEYHRAKSEIMEPISEFLAMLDARTAREVQKLRQNGHKYSGVMLSLAGVALAFTLGAFILLRRRVIVPVHKLVMAAEQVEAGQYDKRVEYASSDELGELASAFNHMTSAIQQDITALRQAEAATKRMSLVFMNAADPIVIEDLSGNIIDLNLEASRAYGWERDEIIGQPIKRIVPDERHEQADEVLQRCLSGSDVRNVEGLRISRDGTVNDVLITLSLLRDENDAPIAIASIAKDITAIREAERALSKAKEKAEEATKVKSDFLANMSHEIRTPMNGIIGMTDLTLDTELTPEQRDYLNMVKISADALLTLINDILDFSKIEAGKLELEPIDFALRDALADMLNTLANRAHSKGLELAYRVPPDLHDALIGDVYRLRQIIVNLVGNAIKFTETGEIVVEVEQVQRTDQNMKLHFSVRDTGVGIPAEKLEAIFEPFSQADASTTRKFGGTGLGLTISVQLVELMGGRIWAESQLGHGSIFQFTAEFALGKPGPTLDTEQRRELLDDLSVLVVDDNETNRRILEEMLGNCGMRTQCVEGAAEALAAMDRAANAVSPFQLVLSDVNMPEMDGFMLFESTRSKPQHQNVPFILLTSAARPGDVARCREISVAAHLIKPIKQSLLMNAIAGAVAGKDAKDLTQGKPRETSDIATAGRILHILLAEDNAVNQKFAVRVIEKAGHSVVVANNGREAVEAWERESYDIVLMDVQMPEMDGLEATGRIRALEREKGTGQHTSIIAMTANAMKGDRERCLEAGMDGYVSKPVRRNTLFSEIDRVLEGC